MLAGRDTERARIRRLLDDAREGRASALLVTGEAGIGKTALLDWASDEAAGLTVVRAAGVESEAELEFSALSDVCRPLLAHLESVPEHQSQMLAGALGLGPATAPDGLAIGAATLSLVAAAAEDRPLLVVVDDAQWVDQPSAEALLFAARRLDADSTALLFGARQGEGRRFEPAGIERLELAGLDAEAALSLLEGAACCPIAREVAERLASATGGNPLALLELARVLGRDQLAGRLPLDDPLPVAKDLEQAFARRLQDLPTETREALTVTAASQSGDLATIGRALAALGLGAAALERAEDSGLLRIGDGRVEFPHPLIRSAAYHAAIASERRAAHRALADALADSARERRAWHLAAAAIEPDEIVAAALEEAARHAAEKTGHAAAGAAYERAARLTPDENARPRRLYEAANAWFLAGRTQAATRLLDEALAGATADLRARALHLRGVIELMAGHGLAGNRILREAAALAEETDTDLAVEILCEAWKGSIYAGEPGDALKTAERARALARRDGAVADYVCDSTLGQALLASGHPAEGSKRIERALSLVDGNAELARSASYLTGAAFCAGWLERPGHSLELARRATDIARKSGAIGLLSGSLDIEAWQHGRSGRWREAYAAASEGLALARDAGQPTAAAEQLTHLAWVDAGRGNDEACRAHAAEALEIAELHGMTVIGWWVTCALALLELGLGRLNEAAALLEPVAAEVEAKGYFDRDISPAANLVEVYVRLGRDEEARAALDRYVVYSTRTGPLWSPAVAERCRGLLAGEDDYEAHFLQALSTHAQDDPFGLARTRLGFGERLRRSGHKREARRELRAAEEAFEKLGAEPWRERARAERRASGETLRRRDPTEEQELTPQELQIALQVAEGKTNKEVGAALFLSHKTVEFHLHRIYRKLGVGSRGELIRRFATEPDAVSA